MSGQLVFDQKGQRLALGHCLGVGGEGAVFALSTSQEVVAKVYKHKADAQKKQKLDAMIRRGSPELAGIAAWPMGVVSDAKGQPLGFLMPRVQGYQPVHMLYGPSHRKTLFPEANWHFLVQAARNVAACFEVVHRHGHVVGDVNQGNVLVSNKALARLIDCDSFQISDGGRAFLCEVGVPHFTPPELQGRPFRGLARTSNHDNFGLALLCFHLLFMGRHPFVGQYRGSDTSLEDAIREFRFAFGARAAALGVQPPPQTVGLELLPSELRNMFDRAFSQEGANGQRRPTASEWVQGLDALRGAVVRCGRQPAHAYWRGLGACPWCAFEAKGGNVFFLTIVAPATGGRFDLQAVWAVIAGVPTPGPAGTPPEGALVGAKQGRALPPGLSKQRSTRLLGRWVALAVCVAIGVGLHPFLGVVLALVALAVTQASGEEAAERERRRQNHQLCVQRMNDFQRQWAERATDRRFDEKLRELSGLRAQHASLDAEYKAEYAKLEAGRREAQLKRFLERYSIDEAGVKGIGSTRATTLSSYGIETAADVTYAAVGAVPGFGPALTKRLVAWQASLMKRFVFNPNEGVHPQDVAALQQRHSAKRAGLERTLREGAATLQRIRSETLMYRHHAPGEAQKLRDQLAQAEADLNM